MRGSVSRLLGSLFAVAGLLTGAPPALASVTIRNIAPRPHHAPAGTSVRDIAASIRFAAEGKEWVVTEENDQNMKATIWVRGRHKAVVLIHFDETNYAIDYFDSENLDYSAKDGKKPGKKYRNRGGVIKGPRIHRNYHRWIENLAAAIELRMKQPVRSQWAPTSKPTPMPTPERESKPTPVSN